MQNFFSCMLYLLSIFQIFIIPVLERDQKEKHENRLKGQLFVTCQLLGDGI